MNSLTNDHLSQDLILRTLDDELTSAERFECESHLAVCESCRLKLASLHEFSLAIESAVHATPVPAMQGTRLRIEHALQAQPSACPLKNSLPSQNPGKVMRRFGWGMALAASLAVGVLIAPKRDQPPVVSVAVPAVNASAMQPANIEVEGESFVSLPYSNADLSSAAPHIVQMQVPVASLADAGIFMEPISSRVSSGPDAGWGVDAQSSVLADVLVGDDGQPRGVHVLGWN